VKSRDTVDASGSGCLQAWTRTRCPRICAGRLRTGPRTLSGVNRAASASSKASAARCSTRSVAPYGLGGAAGPGRCARVGLMGAAQEPGAHRSQRDRACVGGAGLARRAGPQPQGLCVAVLTVWGDGWLGAHHHRSGDDSRPRSEDAGGVLHAGVACLGLRCRGWHLSAGHRWRTRLGRFPWCRRWQEAPDADQ
jgi:hypothetical protein